MKLAGGVEIVVVELMEFLPKNVNVEQGGELSGRKCGASGC
jgi:hypothetical protein